MVSRCFAAVICLDNKRLGILSDEFPAAFSLEEALLKVIEAIGKKRRKFGGQRHDWTRRTLLCLPILGKHIVAKLHNGMCIVVRSVHRQEVFTLVLSSLVNIMH